ncbi:YciI family protein [Streptomyces bobili]|uniref:YciI family protein n=1 Tax=Streptomyces bobili TaxID=67280 RepID=UPI00379B6F62
MKHYLLSVITPTGGEPPVGEDMARIGRNLETFHRELREADAWVFAGGLHGPETATVLRPRGDDVLITDGPYAEGKEYLGGICLIKAPDLDAALHWGRRAAWATTLPIEVRPFMSETDGTGETGKGGAARRTGEA